MKLALIGAAVFGFGSLLHADIGIDGDFSEWAGVVNQTTDPSGDGSGFVDVTWVKAVNEGAELFLYFDTGTIANYQSGSPSQGTQTIQIDAPDGTVITFDFRDIRFEFDNVWVYWTDIGFAGAPTYADDEFEMRFDLSDFGATPGTDVTISMSDSDTVSPFVYTMTTATSTPAVRDPARFAGTEFRIANQNTLHTGLLDGGQSVQLKSVIDAVKADVYTFQEEWDSSEAQIAAVLASVDPHGDGATWNVVKESGTAIASRSTLVHLPQVNTRHIPAIVELPSGPVLVVCVHLKCCGYIGSSEDDQRIDQTDEIIGMIDSLRAGTLGAPYVQYQDVPVVVVGDWNLVGSRTPLTMFENDANLARADVRHLVGEDIYTWRNTSSSYTPGYLDLVAYDDTRMTLRNSFVLDSEKLTFGQLAQLGLLSNSSGGSDHLMVVADFTMGLLAPCEGDANGDSTVDVNDISYVLFRLGDSGTPGEVDGDANGDGVVDVNDISYVLFRLGDACP
jgi:hypothetical protein